MVSFSIFLRQQRAPARSVATSPQSTHELAHARSREKPELARGGQTKLARLVNPAKFSVSSFHFQFIFRWSGTMAAVVRRPRPPPLTPAGCRVCHGRRAEDQSLCLVVSPESG
jgi:hypothetical protein